MVVWKSEHETSETNAEIAASASEIFFTGLFNQQQLTKIGQSFNSLEINNDSNTIVVDITLDGLESRKRRLFAKGNLSILPEDGIFFNSVKITNTDAANAIPAGTIKLNARALKPQNRG